ncbi:hypothetical protein ACK9YZ_23075 [Rhizobium sp. ZK1]|uniref:hypothetical protein n=1 Tax=Rhizobium sp. ZK1 TaxID=3389872 RepID=UPI0039F7090B
MLFRPVLFTKAFGDIIVNDDPAALEVAEASPSALDIGNFQGDTIGLRRLGRDGLSCEMGKAVIRSTDSDDDASRPELLAFGLAGSGCRAQR